MGRRVPADTPEPGLNPVQLAGTSNPRGTAVFAQLAVTEPG